MGSARWWQERRFGLLVQASTATVPAWAPIGEYAGWYRAHIDPDARDVLLHPSPLVETLAHHRARWDHIERYDDFLPFLTFADYDPDAWAGLARDAGMGFVVMVAKHHDGLCWWDAPGTDRTVLHHGPKRNVLGELAAACERADLVFGTSYSLLDWYDERYRDSSYVDDALHPQVLDLVHRYGSKTVWGDGHWGAGGGHWQSNRLIDSVRRIDPEVVVNNRWWSESFDVRTFEHRLADEIMAEPWEMRRGLGAGIGYNRAERDDHLLSPGDVVALLTEVIAKNGHLVLCVGPDADGVIPEAYQERLRAAGGWVRRHTDLVNRGEPWHTWGDDECRYIVVDDVLHAVDVSGRGRFRALDRSIGTITRIESTDGTVMAFDQTPQGTQLERSPRRQARLPVVYRIDHVPPPEPAIELFPDRTTSMVELAPLLADATAGAIVQLGEGHYVGPARIPDGVTLRGLGSDRTTIDGLESVAVVLGAGSKLAHVRVTGGGDRIAWLPKPVVSMAGDGAQLLGCRVDGHVEIVGDGGRVTSCRLVGLVSKDVDRVCVLRSTFSGMNWDCAIDVTGGSSHEIEGCEFDHVLQAVRLTSTVGAEVRGNQIRARWWGVHLVDTEGSRVHANRMVRVMRAVDIEGGTLAAVLGNAVSDGDSGCVVQRGASDVEVSGNRWERCRVGLLSWDAGQVHHRENDAVDLLDDAFVTGP